MNREVTLDGRLLRAIVACSDSAAARVIQARSVWTRLPNFGHPGANFLTRDNRSHGITAVGRTAAINLGSPRRYLGRLLLHLAPAPALRAADKRHQENSCRAIR